MRAWQRSIGYVPQQIFLTDDTVSANIAFGREASEIDQAAVERAARIAELHDFVLTSCPRATPPRSASAASGSPAASASASASPARSTTTPTC